ncbi:Rix1 complex component [Arabidopsis thaliana]|uniref:Rix1 complex component n=1 Tax=Arabidopsis thaliana TaxID=3702 RepID=F4JGW1_ARATH|nr:Rix1 complex component [Arabidopsis thaliana]AEE82411.1 Rix1 complex component [Arabidopsis thaliana]|eukprot:NP_567269.2 Rix1 complex component [Arabidopsis thaliana]
MISVFASFIKPSSLCLWLKVETAAAMILAEQNVAAEKSGLATSKKGLTLKDLLPQTSHCNAKLRKDALNGLKDLLKNHPAELQSHKYAIIQKLRERIMDDDSLVRDALYQLFESVILPACKNDNQSPMVSLLMPYISCAMAHSSVECYISQLLPLMFLATTFPDISMCYLLQILENYKDNKHKLTYFLLIFTRNRNFLFPSIYRFCFFLLNLRAHTMAKGFLDTGQSPSHNLGQGSTHTTLDQNVKLVKIITESKTSSVSQ